jgi:hypothetical protein
MKKPEQTPEDDSKRIAWHPAFITAVTLDLKPYLDKIEILPELPLTEEPLKIDCVIIKKAKGLLIDKKFAVIFRDWNILEYKSPEDHVSVNDFQKVYAYACLYSAFKKVPVNDITISFIESRYPRKLVGFLRKTRGFTVEKTSPGIYTVKGDAVAVQVIDSRHLPEEENLWLKHLRGRLDKNTRGKVIAEADKQDKTVSLEPYINVISRANPGFFEEVTEMVAPTFREVLESSTFGANWRAEIKAEGEARGREAERAEVARNLAKLGIPAETIITATQLDPEKVKALYQ